MATLTSNFEFNKPETTDNISPIPYNDNFDKLDEVLSEMTTDYIVGQGVQGDWTWRRWSSGVLECYTTISLTNQSITSKIGVLYYVLANIALPFTFSDTTPWVIGTANAKGNTKALLSVNIRNTSSTAIDYCVVSASSLKGVAVDVDLYVRGTWN